MFEVEIGRTAEKQLARLDRALKNRVLSSITALSADPQPHGCRKIKSEHNVWRIRVGDWRIGYLIDHSLKKVQVIRIVHRSEFYD